MLFMLITGLKLGPFQGKDILDFDKNKFIRASQTDVGHEGQSQWCKNIYGHYVEEKTVHNQQLVSALKNRNELIKTVSICSGN